ncbi:MAG TPA: VOC family protein [Acidiferrobacteraceae bacterium]|nr:VOC family protein [Acidiferrobacteraceae bacterium]
MLVRLTHIALPVQDLPASSRFYQDFCGLRVIHDRGIGTHRTQWLADPSVVSGSIALVLIAGGHLAAQAATDYRHLGFAVPSRAAVDACAARAAALGCLAWPPREEPWPLGYYCGVADPDGQVVEFSFGQPDVRSMADGTGRALD